MIAYCKADAQTAFTGLADILEKVAATSIGGDQPISNAVLLDKIRQIVEADPTANPIRKAFEKTWDIAAHAGDAETERELHTRHIDLIADFNAIASADDQANAGATYQRHLRSHAAWVRAVSASIDDSDKRADTQANEDAITRMVVDANSQVLAKLGEIHGDIRDLQADTTASALNTAKINNGVAWLVSDRQSKIKGNKERGKINQATGNTEESERAAHDMTTAENRVHDRMKHGAKNVVGECRKVCKEFTPLTTKKNELGKYEAYAPLTGADGKPIKPETLAKNYRKRFGTKKAKMAKAARAAKPKRRTK